MNWRPAAMILASFAAAGIGVWFGPVLLDWLALGQFAWIGELALPIVLLSLLDMVLRRMLERSPG